MRDTRRSRPIVTRAHAPRQVAKAASDPPNLCELARISDEAEYWKTRYAADTVRARPGRLSALRVSHSKSVFYGAFVRARRVPNATLWWLPARADEREEAKDKLQGLQDQLSALMAVFA